MKMPYYKGTSLDDSAPEINPFRCPYCGKFWEEAIVSATASANNSGTVYNLGGKPTYTKSNNRRWDINITLVQDPTEWYNWLRCHLVSHLAEIKADSLDAFSGQTKGQFPARREVV